MNTTEHKLSNQLIKFRWLLLILAMIGVIIAASGAKNLYFTNNYRVFFSADNPQLLAFEALEKTYAKNDNILFAIKPKSPDVFTHETLAAVEWLTEQSWQIPYSTRVDSISNFQHTRAEEDDLIVENLYRNAQTLSDEQLTYIKDISLKEPLLLNRLISPSGHVTGISVTVQRPGLDETKETPEAVAFARDLRDQLLEQYPDLDIYMTGGVMIDSAFSEAAQKDIVGLVPLSFGIMLLMLTLLLKGFSSTFAVLIVILCSVISAMGIAGHIGYPVTPPLTTAPTIILTMAIANCVHILVSFLHAMRRGMEKADAMRESLRINLQPVFLASVTTAIGFLSMNFSDVPPFQHLGNVVSVGVMASFILSITILPALMLLLPVRIKQSNTHQSNGRMANFGHWVVKQHRNLLWITAAFVIFLVSFLPKNELNDVFVNYFDSSVLFRTDTDFIADNLTGMNVFEYSVESGEESGINEPGFLKELSALTDWFRNQPEVIHVTSLTDIVKRLNMNMHGDDEDWYLLPEERNLSAQYLLLYEMSLPYGLDLNNQINIEKSATRMIVSFKTLSSNEYLELEHRAADWLDNNTSHIKRADASGTSLMFSHIGKRNIKSMLTGTTVALIGISLILIIALRSIKIGLISLIPNLVPAALGFGLWGMFVGEVGLALSVVTGMTLGIVIDDTVHFLSKYLRARREHKHTASEAVVYAFSSVGSALLITSAVLVAGFLVLATSAFQLNAGMGLLTAIVISFAIVADFLLLPSLLIKLEEKKNV